MTTTLSNSSAPVTAIAITNTVLDDDDPLLLLVSPRSGVLQTVLATAVQAVTTVDPCAHVLQLEHNTLADREQVADKYWLLPQAPAEHAIQLVCPTLD